MSISSQPQRTVGGKVLRSCQSIVPSDPEGELFFFFFFKSFTLGASLASGYSLPWAGAGIVGAKTGARRGSQRALWLH